MVLSLHNTALLNIIANINSYRSDVLALLPLRVREELLKNVPVAEMWWLERSSVADGIDMNSLWTAILAARMNTKLLTNIWEKIHKQQPVYSMGTNPTKRETYMEVLSYVILNKDTPEVQQLLTVDYSNISHFFLDLVFGVRHCLGITDWKKFLEYNPHWTEHFQSHTKEDVVISTKNYLQHYTKPVSDVQLISLLLDYCGHSPKQISIYVSVFTKTSLWRERYYPNVRNRIHRWVSKVESLTFSAIEHTDSICVGNNDTQTYPSALRFIATEILATGTNHLQAIQIQAIDTKTLARLVSTIAPLFAKLSAPNAQKSINHVPYEYLKELKFLSLEKHHPADIPSESLLCECISDIIRYQYRLENVFFTGLNLAGPPATLQRLPMSLIGFVHGINWKYLHFSDSLFSFPLFKSVVETYLHSPAKDTKSLSLSGVKIGQPCGPLMTTAYIKMADSNTRHKQIVVRETFLPMYVVHWLFNPFHHFRLHSLELDAISVQPNVNLLTIITHHMNLVVEVLCLKRIVIPHNHETVKDFQLLFSKVGLKALIIKECHIGETGVLNAITAAISTMRFWPGRCLTFLNLEQNKLGMENCPSIQNFFHSLFRLHGTEYLGLDISGNGFGPHHFAIVYNMWRMYSNGRRLRQFKCDGNNMNHHQKPFIAQVAEQVF